MKNTSSVLMRIAQVLFAIGLALLLALLVTGHFQTTSIFFIVGFASVQASIYLYLIGILSACVQEMKNPMK